MAGEHRDAVVAVVPEAAPRTFTLKELVRLLEALPPAPPVDDPDALVDRVAAAHELRLERRGAQPARRGHRPIRSGCPLDTYRAIAWELDEWTARLVDGLFGAEPGATARPAEEAG